MLHLTTLFTVILAVQGLAVPVNDQYDELIKNFLLLVKQELALHDPELINDIKDQHIQADDIDLFLSQTNTQIVHFSKFVVDKVTTIPAILQTSIELIIPEVIVGGRYSIYGTALGRKVSGSGDITVTIENLSVRANGTFTQPDSSLQLDSFMLGCDANNLKTHITGLNVEGMPPEQMDQFAQSIMVTAIDGKKDKITALASVYFQSTINEAIAGKPLSAVITWIKSLIH